MDRAPPLAVTIFRLKAEATWRADIITEPFYGEFRRADSGVRPWPWCAWTVHRLLSRLVVFIAARSQRPPAHMDGHAAQDADGSVRGERNSGLDRGMPRALRDRPQGWGSDDAAAVRGAPCGQRARDVSALRRPRGPDSVDPSTAGAVQNLHPAGWRGGHW